MTDPVTFPKRAAEIEALFATHPVIRAVNFHNSSKAKTDEYDRQLAHYGEFFTSVNQDELPAGRHMDEVQARTDRVDLRGLPERK